MRDLKEGGRGVTEAAVVQSAANYYSILSSITDLEVSLHQLNNTMSLLLNTMPREWEVNNDLELHTPAILRAGVPMAELAANFTFNDVVRHPVVAKIVRAYEEEGH